MGYQTNPIEVAVGAGDIWLAPIGSTFPDLSASPSSPWVQLVTKERITEDGIIVRGSQTLETDAFRTAGLTAPLKAARVAEDIEIEFTVIDMSPNALAKAWHLDTAQITDTAAGSGVAGNKNMPLYRGLTVKEMMMVLRLPYSPDATAVTDNFAHQYDIPRVVQAAAPELVYVKGNPVGLRFVLKQLYDATYGLGKIRQQDAAAS